MKVTADIWTEAPEPGIPEPPALLADGDSLWLAYEHSQGKCIAIVRFGSVIEHHLTSINDEGLGRHPYAKAGLQFYSFHELTGSQETKMWSVLGARHWVVTFKDNTLDVVAESCELVHADVCANDPMTALKEMRCPTK